MMFSIKIKKISYFLFAVLVISACSTQKKKGDLTKFQKFYQNTTSEFNGYFNANILYEESLLKLNDQAPDNYNKVLPIYKYTEADNPKEVAEDLDEAVKKVSVVVSLHRESDWVDDCYLLMGKSLFLKQDYETAQEALEYLVAEFNPQAIAKKKTRKAKKAIKKEGRSTKGKSKKKKEVSKKKKNRKKEIDKKKKNRKKEIKAKKKARAKGKKVPSTPKISKEEKDRLAKLAEEKKLADQKAAEKEAEAAAEVKPEAPKTKYFMKHRPCYQEGVLWLAKTYVERDNYIRAEFLFDELANDPYTFKDIKAQLAPAMAYFYLEQKKYDEAVNPLNQAIEYSKDKNEKGRYAFILAQIHQNAGRNSAALANFELAKKYSNNYEMEFSAELNVLKNSWATGRITEEQVQKELGKMLKEAKNAEYQDQIYFVLADIAIKAGNKEKAIEYLAKSLETNSLNQAQKGESHLTLANLYYEDEQYVKAKTNYDAALVALSKNDERYPETERLATGLADIVKNIEIIALQDSLLKVSEMSDSDRRKLAAEKKRKEAEAKLAAAKATNNSPTNSKFPKSNIPIGGGGGNLRVGGVQSNFFAYNDKALKKGRREFERKWPGAQLEDNWRRSNRQSISIDDNIADISSYEEALTDEEVANYLKGVPKTDAEKQKANELVMGALFQLGTLYRDRLKNNQKAVNTLEELNKRYPENRHELESWYFLYLAYGDLGDNGKKRAYFDKILEKYGNTIYARVLKDPDYLNKTQDKESKINTYYNDTYAMFTGGEYQEVKTRVEKVNRLFGGNNSHQPRFALLDAMSTGALKDGGGKEVYVKKLKELIGRYPNTDEEKRAKEILRLLGDKSIVEAGLLDKEKMENLNKVFRVEENKVHYGIVVFDDKVDLNKVKANISDYNRTNHKLDRLRISNIYLGSDTNRPVIIIRKFKDKALAMKYYNGVVSDLKDFISVKTGFDLFVVNQYNYRQVLRQKSVDEYRLFFAENYLK